jgi:hypothetical protein
VTSEVHTVRKRQWFLLGLLGTIVGMAARLLRGRRDDQVQLGRWETPTEEE